MGCFAINPRPLPHHKNPILPHPIRHCPPWPILIHHPAPSYHHRLAIYARPMGCWPTGEAGHQKSSGFGEGFEGTFPLMCVASHMKGCNIGDHIVSCIFYGA
jgi:hypothetical protein